MSVTRHALVLVFAWASCWLGGAEAADARWSVDTGYDSNLNRAGSGQPESDDVWFGGTWDIRERRQHDGSLAWVYGAQARGELWLDYSDLSHLDVSARAGLRFKPGLGREVLRYGLDLTLGHAAFSDSRRSRSYLALDGTIRRPLGIATEIYGGYRYLHAGADARVYDTERHAVHAGWARSITAADAFRVEVELRDGDILSVTPPDPPVLAVSRAAARDDTFAANWRAYRLDGVTRILRLEWTHVLEEGGSLGASLEAFEASADAGPDYDGLRLGLDYRFGD